MFFNRNDGPGGSREKRVLPLLPLRDIIVFPHMVVPLFVGREKSINGLEEALEPLDGIRGLQDLLAVVELDRRQVHDDGVGEARGVVDRLHGHQHLGRDALVELHVALERGLH